MVWGCFPALDPLNIIDSMLMLTNRVIAYADDRFVLIRGIYSRELE